MNAILIPATTLNESKSTMAGIEMKDSMFLVVFRPSTAFFPPTTVLLKL